MQDDRLNPTPRKRRGKLLAAASAAVIVIVGLGAFGVLSQTGQNANAPHLINVAEKVVRPAPPRLVENGAPFSFADLVERVSPAVVTVTVEQKTNASNSVMEEMGGPDNIPDPFRQFFQQFNNGRRAVPEKAVAMGSGFIIDKAGYIVTNNHVIEHASKITVKLPDNRQFTAKLIGADPATDIALLKVNSDKPLPTVEFGDDRQLRVGDWVVAVGNPFGLSNTVTAGIVSSIGRQVGNGPYTDYIQIDAPINRGNSGGPTFDLRGQVVGMNTMIYSPSGGSVGIGFAIPSSLIHEVVAQLKAHGRVNHGWLGVQIQNMTPEMASSVGLKNQKGAIVAVVQPNSPASAAGIRQGDIILAIDGKGVDDSTDLSRRVADLPAGSKTTFTVARDGKNETLNVTIGHKNEQVASLAPQGPRQNGKTAAAHAMGLALTSLTPELRQEYNLDSNVDGVVITNVDPNSDAAEKGIQAGDVLTAVGNKPVHTPQDVQGRIAAAHAMGRKNVLCLVTTQQGPRFVAVDIGQA